MFTRCRFQDVPIRVPFSKSTVFKICRQKMCRFRVNGRPIRRIFHRFQNLPASCDSGGTLVLFVVRGRAIFWGYFFQTITELWVSFSQFFYISRNYGCPFQGIIHNFRNYGPDIYSICGIMALKSTRIYGIMGINFSGKMARPRHIIG